MPMKTLLMYLSIFAMLFISITNVQAQLPTKPSPEQYLTADQMAKYQADVQIAELEKKLQTYGNWVGVGSEIGIAVREGLGAVVEVSDQFGKTDVGKFTMIMIAWKVMGKDIIRIMLGLLFISITFIFLFKSYKRTCIARSILIENPGLFKYPKKYEVVLTEYSADGLAAMTIFYVVAFLGTVGITFVIMFS